MSQALTFAQVFKEHVVDRVPQDSAVLVSYETITSVTYMLTHPLGLDRHVSRWNLDGFAL
jgi:hypothetical protein